MDLAYSNLSCVFIREIHVKSLYSTARALLSFTRAINIQCSHSLCFCHEWELNRALLQDYRNAIHYSIVGQLAELNHQTTLNYKLEKPIWFYAMVIWYDSSAIISIFIVLFTNPTYFTDFFALSGRTTWK